MSDDAVVVFILIAIALMVLALLLYLAAGLVIVFAAFVMELPLIIAVLMFVLFPPTLVVFLVGLAFIRFGVADRLAESKSDEVVKLSKRDMGKERERRKALGYDE